MTLGAAAGFVLSVVTLADLDGSYRVIRGTSEGAVVRLGPVIPSRGCHVRDGWQPRIAWFAVASECIGEPPVLLLPDRNGGCTVIWLTVANASKRRVAGPAWYYPRCDDLEAKVPEGWALLRRTGRGLRSKGAP